MTPHLSSILVLIVLLSPVVFATSLTKSTVRQTPRRLSASGCAGLPMLVCHLSSTAGYSASGVVSFQPIWTGHPSANYSTCFLRIRARVANLASGMHGFHIHTYGDLGSEDGKSTGGHFTNPAGSKIPHGAPADAQRHWGDFGNLVVNAKGIAVYDRVDYVARLGGILGRAITLHAGSDKGSSSQPSGGAGSRVAFGVIGYANPDVPTQLS